MQALVGARTDYLSSLSPRRLSRISGIGAEDVISDGGGGYEPTWIEDGPSDAPSAQPQYTMGENTIDEAFVRAYMGKLRAMGYTAPDSGDPNDAGVRQHVGYFQSAWNGGGYVYPPPVTLNDQGILDAATMNAIDQASGVTAQAVVQEQHWEAQNPQLFPTPTPSPTPGPITPVVDKPADDSMKKYVIYGAVALAGVIAIGLLFSSHKQENPRRRRNASGRSPRRPKGRYWRRVPKSARLDPRSPFYGRYWTQN